MIDEQMTCVPSALLQDQRLKWNDIGLLVFLCSGGTVEEAIEKKRCGKNAIYASLTRIKAAGYMKTQKHKNGRITRMVDPDPQNRDLGNTQNRDLGKRVNGAGFRAIEKKQSAEHVIEYLNAETGRKYRPTQTNLNLVIARFDEGFTQDEIESVIHSKAQQWGNDDKMAQYLRPATLFNRTKFSQYIGEVGAEKPRNGADQWLAEETEKDNIIEGSFHGF